MSIPDLYTAGLIAYAIGIVGGTLGRYLSLLGALLELAASIAALTQPAPPSWTLPSGVPYLTYSVNLDPLSAYFLLALSILALATAIYSFGYKGPQLNLLLLSLTLVFTAANVLFFLIAWEMMALAAYLLVVYDHESAEARRGGLLYFFMSRGGTGMLLVGFLMLASAAGSLEFRLMARHLDPPPSCSSSSASASRPASSRCTSGCPPLIRSRPATSPR